MEQSLTGAAGVIQELKRMLVDDLQVRLVPDQIPDDCSLMEDGLALDSILIAELIAKIEDRFGLQFDDRVLEPDLFNNLSMLAGFVLSESRAAQVARDEVPEGEAPCRT
jgi:acyl carrier protein